MEYSKLFTLVQGSHFFLIRNPKPRVMGILVKFASNYATTKYEKDRSGRGRFVPDKVFASRLSDNTEFRFHAGQYLPFLTVLERELITPDLYDVEQLPVFKPKSIRAPMNDGWELRDFQEESVKFILGEDPGDFQSRLVSLPTGTGKALSNDTDINTVDGVIKNGDLRVGDTVYAPDGQYTEVLGVYPQGITNLFRVTMEDGRSLDCNREHLWSVKTTGELKVVTTETLIEQLKKGEVFIPLPAAIGGYTNLHLPLEVIASLVAGSYSSLFSTLRFIASRCLFQTVREVTGTLVETFRFFQGPSKNSAVIDLPVHRKIELLNRLVQNEQSLGGSRIMFTTKHSAVADLAVYLMRSLGGIASTEKPFYRGSNIVRLSHTDIEQIFKYRHFSRRSYDAINFIKVTSILPIADGYSTCISVDHPDRLYVAGDFITTHNTVTALAAVSQLSKRTAITVLPSYMEKWGGDISNVLNVPAKDIMLIRGSKQLKGLIAAGLDSGIKVKFIIISITTLQNFFKAYEADAETCEQEFGICPDKLYETLGVGTIIIDEAHQQLYSVYKLLSYSHVDKVIGLSATLLSNDPMIQKLQHVMFPKEIRYDSVKMERYIKCYAISYAFKDFKRSNIRTSERGNNSYSHIAFEKSILKDRTLTNNYLALVNDLVKIGYREGYQSGDKLIIFAASIAMCDTMTKYFKQQHADLDVRRYVAEDPYEDVIEPDIRITTIQNAGTALDVPSLVTSIMTVNILSPVSNLQALGRLRKIPGRDVKFYYMFGEEIPKHVDFHRKRLELFRDRTEFIKEFHSPILV